jgi:hypothetical protein
MSLNFSIFQEPWWLHAVTGGKYDEVTVTQSDKVVGRLPFVSKRQRLLRISTMPEFTHLLGPAIDAGDGKPQTQLVRRLSITRALIDKLPAFAFFKQTFDPSVANGLALVDGLAFKDRGFQVEAHYTFKIDCHTELAVIWNGMHTTVRQHIRRAKKQYSVAVLDDPDQFVHFYLKNNEKLMRRNWIDFTQFATVFSECKRRNNGKLLYAAKEDGTPAAMTFLVWDHNAMYYLLSTRAPGTDHRGSINLLLWSAIKHANELKLKFDFDGVYSSGTARFLSGFGGKVGVRLIVTRTQPVYQAIKFMKAMLGRSAEEFA